jgi:hypothetical protein
MYSGQMVVKRRLKKSNCVGRDEDGVERDDEVVEECRLGGDFIAWECASTKPESVKKKDAQVKPHDATALQSCSTMPPPLPPPPCSPVWKKA